MATPGKSAAQAAKRGNAREAAKPANQGKMIGAHVSPAREGSTTGNGSMMGGGSCVEYGVHVKPIRGSKRSF